MTKEIGWLLGVLRGEAPVGVDWVALMALARAQGVLGLVWEAVERDAVLAASMPVEVKLAWWGNVRAVEDALRRKREVSADYARQLLPLRCVVLKGVDYARRWPNALHREYGDLDHFSGEDFDAVNARLGELGVATTDNGYKHSHADFGGVPVENHRFLTGFAGSPQGRRIELVLQELLAGPTERIDGTDLLSPCASFTALFMLLHAQRHFLNHGVTLRHIFDWIFFLRHDCDKVDWEVFSRNAYELGVMPWARVVTAFAIERLGLEESLVKFDYEPPREGAVEQFARDIFSPHDRDGERHWWMKLGRVCRGFVRKWRFREYLLMPYWRSVWTTIAYSSYLHRKPKP